MRDYGTGEWEGGDEACDHAAGRVKGRFDYDISEKQASSVGTDDARHKSECPTCGATRKDRQIGLEPTPDEFVHALVEVFRGVRRVLRDDGTVWLNLGDSYAGNGKGDARSGLAAAASADGYQRNLESWKERTDEVQFARPNTLAAGYKQKDLLGIPWLVAFALRADGWYLRADIIWNKPNPMPESVTDRPTRSHEFIFLLSKNSRYFYDADSIREDITSEASIARNRSTPRQIPPPGHRQANGDERGYRGVPVETAAGRNKRDVWTVSTKPFSASALRSGTTYTASPNCPEHGLLAAPGRWQRAADGEQPDHHRYRIDGNDARRALGRLDGSDASSDPSSSDSPSNGSSRTSGSTPMSRTPDPSSPEAAVASSHARARTMSTGASGESPAGSSDSLDLDGASTANARSTETHKSDAASSLGGSAGEGLDNRTPYMAPRGEPLASGDSDSHDSSGTGGRSRGICTCEEYNPDHFATFPPDLIEPCVLAGAPERACGACGAPWERVVEVERVTKDRQSGAGWLASTEGVVLGRATEPNGGLARTDVGRNRTLGFEPSCGCNADPAPGTVLDPFAGAGTTGLVAVRNRRSFVGLELNPEYAQMACDRIATDIRLGHRPPQRVDVSADQIDIFEALS